MFRSLGVGAMNWAWAKDSNNLAISLVLAALTIGPCRCPIRRWYNWLTRCEGAWGLPGARRTISAFLCWFCPIALSGKCPRQGPREGAKGCLQMTKQPNPCSLSCAWCPVSKMVRPLNKCEDVPVSDAICLITSSCCLSSIALRGCSSNSIILIPSSWVKGGESLVNVAVMSGYFIRLSTKFINSTNVGRGFTPFYLIPWISGVYTQGIDLSWRVGNHYNLA